MSDTTSIVTAIADGAANLRPEELPDVIADTRPARVSFLIKAPKAPRDAAVRWKQPIPLHTRDMDEASRKGKGYRSMEERIASAEKKGWLSGRDGWVSDRKNNISKMASRKNLIGKLEQETDILNSYWGWRGIIEPEYDLLESWTLLDTESFYKRAIDRMHSLAFREGVQIVGEEPAYVNYLEERIAQIGYVMGKGFTQWLKDVIRNLWVCSNCIVSKIRDDDASGGTKNARNENRVPIAGYAIIPPHTVFPFLDGRGHIEKWRRFYKDGRPYRDYLPEDIIHFKWDVKPGHIYGTPRSVTVRDDIFALRRLEENVELLLVQHLFPLFHVKVGNEKAPVEYLPDGSSEIDYVRSQIMNMPKEGVFVSDDRCEIEVHGAEGKGADPGPMVQHFKARVFTGLGVSGIDMGEATGTLATADNVSQNLKDLVKADLQCFGDQVEMEICRELFAESRVKMSVQRAVAGTHLSFGEIDVDGQIKRQTHALNSFQSHAIDQDELRKHFHKNPLTKEQEKKTHFAKHMVGLENVKAQNAIKQQAAAHENTMEQQEHAQAHQAKQTAVTAASTKKTTVKKSNSKTGASHTTTTEEPTSHAKKALSNVVQPANQHGKNLDPHNARSSEDPALAQAVYDALLVERRELSASGLIDMNAWRAAVARVVDASGLDLSDAASLKHVLSLSSDEDLIYVVLRGQFALDEPASVPDGIDGVVGLDPSGDGDAAELTDSE